MGAERNRAERIGVERKGKEPPELKISTGPDGNGRYRNGAHRKGMDWIGGDRIGTERMQKKSNTPVKASNLIGVH
jgi:hypothetical protein